MQFCRDAARSLTLIVATFAISGCTSTDEIPSPLTASFNMQPVPRKTDAAGSIFAAPGKIVSRIAGKTPMRFVKMMESADSPDNRRIGILNLAETDFGQHTPYTDRYRQIAKADSDALVRAAAIRALNASRDQKAVPIFIAALNDTSPQVRLQAAKALSNIPDPSASDALARTLGNQAEQKDVRIAASEALRHYKNLSVARVLAASLSGKDFSIAWQSHLSLSILTGRDYGFAEKNWLDYFTGPEKPLS